MFSEYVVALDDDSPSLSMARPAVRATSQVQGKLTPTGAPLDFAIEGEGFFLVETGEGRALTRNGAFRISAQNELVTPDGNRVLDAAGAPIFVPSDSGGIALSSDGTLSADGQPLAQIGLYRPERPEDTVRGSGALFQLRGGATPVPVEEPVIVQRFLETSNVDPITEMARLIEVHRAYEAGQDFLKTEDERKQSVIATLGAKA